MHTTVKRFAFLTAAGIAAMPVMSQPLQSRGTDEDGWKQVRWRFDAKQPLKLETAERPQREVLLSPGGETIGTEISAQPDPTHDDID